MILLCMRLRWSPQSDLSLDVAPPNLRCALSVTLPALCEPRPSHFPRVFRARQHCHKVESKVDGGSRSLARDDPAKVHHALINTLRARNFDARIARRRRPFHCLLYTSDAADE